MSISEKISNEFNEAVEIRKELNSVHWKDYNDLALIFSIIFKDEKGMLKQISDINYYQGGYPSPTSPPKLQSMLSKIGKVARYYSFIGRLNEFNQYLHEFGFEINVIDSDYSGITLDYSELQNAKPKVAKTLDRVMKRFGFTQGNDAKEMIEWFLQETSKLQHVICTEADKIKIDLYNQVEVKLADDEDKIDKSGFTKAVSNVANKQLKEEKRKDTNGLVAKTLEKAELLANNGEFIRESILDGNRN